MVHNDPMVTTMNDSTRRHADHCKISYEEYQQQLIDRVDEFYKYKKADYSRESSPKEYKFTAKESCLIVGSGPSYYKNIEFIKKFPGRIITSDALFIQALKDDIRPNHIMTLEVNINKILTRMYSPERELIESLDKKPTFIASSWTSHPTYNMLATHKLAAFMWRFVEEPRISNVGLFGILYAYHKLKADKIFLVGMEHDGKPYEQCVYDTWITDFYHFVRDMKGMIINCSNGGVLYGEDVIDSSLERLDIEKKI